LVLTLPLTGQAHEGFWLFNRVPRAAIKQAVGVELTDAWLQRVQQASVRFPGGSGSFVSPDGLVLTNHHVSLDLLHQLSSPGHDLVKHGFLAARPADERRAPSLELMVLDGIEDVTARVNAAAAPGMSAAAAFAARRSAIAAIEEGTTTGGGLDSEVVTLFQGAQYHLYRYRKFSDVRLVFAPEFEIAFFGGDADNFTFPRYALDVTLWRVYENGRPLRVKHFLPLSTAGAREGDAVFTAGHPAQTQRLNTVAHLEFLRDHALPLSIDTYTQVRRALEAYGRGGVEARRQVDDDLFTVENSLKSWHGQLQGLTDPALLTVKRDAEREFRLRVAANPEWQQRFGGAWDQVAGSRARLAAYNRDRVFFENGMGLSTQYFTLARTLLRWSAERLKANSDRLPEYTDARKVAIERQMGATVPIHPGVEQAKLSATLMVMSRVLGPRHALLGRVLAGQSPAARAEALVAGTTLGEAPVRARLLAGGEAAIAASSDPFIALARLLEPRSRELRRQYDNEVIAVEREAYARIAQAMFAVSGDSAYPDGTFTLRLSYGQVKGYREATDAVKPFTTVMGLYERGAAKGLAPPYRYPDSWSRARASIAMDTPFNLVSTNDIVGGNSGSPLINPRGELVGLVFDGNIHSLPGYFGYDGALNRAISVDARVILQSLKTVYKAERIVKELTRSADLARW
jgi:hypothetical protein